MLTFQDEPEAETVKDDCFPKSRRRRVYHPQLVAVYIIIVKEDTAYG